MDEQLLQQLLALVMGQLGGGQGPNSAAGFSPPSGGLQVPVDLTPDSFTVEPDILAQNAQNVPPNALLPSNFASPSGSPEGFPITQAGSNQSTSASPDNFGLDLAQGIGTDQGGGSSSDFNFKAAGNAVSGAMNALASGIAKQGQQASEQAMRLMQKGNDPRLRALMQPVAPIGGTTGVGDVNQAALQQLLALFLPQR